MPDRSSLARALRDLRIEKGWTLKELEEATGVHLSYISAIENDRRGAGDSTLSKLAEAFADSDVGAKELVKKLQEAKSKGEELVLPPRRSAFTSMRLLKTLLFSGVAAIRGERPKPAEVEILEEDPGFSVDFESKEVSQSAVVRLDDKKYRVRISVSEVNDR